MNISIIGLGKLGLPIAACWASNQHHIYGADANREWVASLRPVLPLPLCEPGLDELVAKVGHNLTVTTDTNFAVTESDTTFIVVPTPSNSAGEFSTNHVAAACRDIGMALRAKSGYHLVVLMSTVMPGATENIRGVLEAASGKKSGRDFGLCYNPVFVALGSVIRDFMHPNMVLIGESDKEAGNILAALYMSLCQIDSSRIARMGFVDAELTKLAVNSYVTTKITFANVLARLCERLPGSNVDVVTSAMGMDGRIGQRYLKGGIGYGGPCFPRDSVALLALAKRLGAPGEVARSVNDVNCDIPRRLADLAIHLRNSNEIVGVLGLTYKPNTNVVQESQGMLLARALDERDVPVVIYDPAAMDTAGIDLPQRVYRAQTLAEFERESDIVIIATAWPEFKQIGKSEPRPRVVVDCWRMLIDDPPAGIDYIPLGIGGDHAV